MWGELMARQVEVRVFDERAERMFQQRHHFHFDVRHNWAAYPGQQRIEINGLRGPTLTYYPGKPIDFGPEKYVQPKSLQPFYRNRYDNVDQLLPDMLVEGYFITDYRRLSGAFTHYSDVLPKIAQGYVVESYRGQVILVKRELGTFHGDIWIVDFDVVRALKHRKLLKRDDALKHGCGHRKVYRQGEATLETLPVQQRVLLDERQCWITRGLEQAAARLREEQENKARQQVEGLEGARCPSPAQPLHADVVMRSWFPKIEAPAFKKAPRAQPISADTILAYDHNGTAITSKEVVAEGRKTPPKGLPADLMPDAPEDCSDEQWERLMLIEQVKFRRLHGL